MRIIFDDLAYKGEYSHLSRKSGLYFIFGFNNKLLYIGWAKLLNERLSAHFAGHSKNTRHFMDEMKIAKVIYADKFDHLRKEIFLLKGDKVRDIEFYLIEKCRPKYNINFSDWR